MADYLTINQHAIEILDGSAADETPIIIGDEGRSFSGGLLPSRRAIKRSWGGTTPPKLYDEGEAIRRLCLGEGHHWSFDDSSDWHYSSRGLNVDSETGATHKTSAPSPKFGGGYIELAATVQLEWQGGTLFTDEWTVMVWKWDGASAWEHWIIDDAGNKWLDGVATATAIPFLTVDAAGGIILGDSGSGAPEQFDDLVALPYRIGNLLAASFGVATRAFSDLPFLELSGEIVNNKVVDVVGTAIASPLQFNNAGTWVQNGRRVRVAFDEK